MPFEGDPGTDDKIYTVDFRLVNEKVVVRAKINDAAAQDFVVDTGAENTVITRPTAQRLGITPVTYTLSAGVGRIGLRGLQLARIDSLELGSLKLRNASRVSSRTRRCAASRSRKPRRLSPLALGYSMVIDYKTPIDLRQAPAGGAEGLRAADAGCIASPRCAAPSTAATRRTSSSTPAAK